MSAPKSDTETIGFSTGLGHYIDGERGTIVHTKYARGAARLALVKMDASDRMMCVDVGATALVCNCGADALPQRREHLRQCQLVTGIAGVRHYVVAGVRQVDRDEFDELTGITELRRSCGWTF